MPKPATKTPLDLARALLRYSRMDDAARAYTKLHDEWPPAVARILDKVLWSEVELRSEREIVRDLRALNRKAAAQSKAVRDFIAKGMSAQRAVDKVLAADRRMRKA